MNYRTCLKLIVLITSAAASGSETAHDESFRNLVEKHCLDCHQGSSAEADVRLDQLFNDLPWVKNRDTWRRVAQVIELRSMPPVGEDEIDDSDRRAMITSIERHLDDFDYSQIKNPGHEPIRRLTHREFENTLNDLLHTRLRVVVQFPRELRGATGFDNEAAVLSMQAALTERYVPITERAIEQSSARWRSIQSDVDAKRALRRFVPRAYRRPATSDELDSVIATYEAVRKSGRPIKVGLQAAMEATLLSPAFLMKIELSGSNASGDSVDESRSERISSFELASRVSYFLWSSMPDDELFRLAAEQKLDDPQILVEQVRRMIEDPKAERFAAAFVGQWLSTEHVGREIRHDPIDEPWCTDSLMDAMREETAYFFLDLLRSNDSFERVIDADYSFATAELAEELYDLDQNRRQPNGLGRISLRGTSRRGVLGQAAVLAAMSGLENINISRRGSFVLDRLLGEQLPEPPPEARELADSLGEDDELSSAEKVHRHARDQRCSRCHQRIDPVGAALASFGSFGRAEETGDDGDVSRLRSLPNGDRLRNANDLREYLLTTRRDDFVRNIVERIMEYAMNRQLQYFDEPAVLQIIEQFEDSGLKMQSLLHAVITSYPFQYRRQIAALNLEQANP